MSKFNVGDKVRLKVAVVATNQVMHHGGSEHTVKGTGMVSGCAYVGIMFGDTCYMLSDSYFEPVPEPFVWAECPERLKGSGFWMAVDADGSEYIYEVEPKLNSRDGAWSPGVGRCWRFRDNCGDADRGSNWARVLGLTAFPDMSHLPPHERKVKL